MMKKTTMNEGCHASIDNNTALFPDLHTAWRVRLGNNTQQTDPDKTERMRTCLFGTNGSWGCGQVEVDPGIAFEQLVPMSSKIVLNCSEL